jgi:hypothetical protein
VAVAPRSPSSHRRGVRVAPRTPLYRNPKEEPVFASLTDAERDELSKKVAEANKRSESGGGRR